MFLASVFELGEILAGVVLAIGLFMLIGGLGGTPLRHGLNRLAAEEKAERLLQSHLTPEEWRLLQTQGYLRVPSPSTPGRIYLIPRDRSLVRVYEQGKPVLRLCVGPVENVPDADVILMHKLLIEGAEDEYLRTANYF